METKEIKGSGNKELDKKVLDMLEKKIENLLDGDTVEVTVDNVNKEVVNVAVEKMTKKPSVTVALRSLKSAMDRLKETETLSEEDYGVMLTVFKKAYDKFVAVQFNM